MMSMRALLTVAAFAIVAVFGAAQGNLDKARNKRETAAILRLVQVMEAEAKGMDIRDDFEKVKEAAALERFNDSKHTELVTRLATIAVSRRALILEARKRGRDLRTDAEKAEEAAATGLDVRDADYNEARKRFLFAIKLRETALGNAKDDDRDIRTELERGADALDMAVKRAPEYQTALKRLRKVIGEAAEDYVIRPETATLAVAKMRLKYMSER
jgi:hypothetical protein